MFISTFGQKHSLIALIYSTLNFEKKFCGTQFQEDTHKFRLPLFGTVGQVESALDGREPHHRRLSPVFPLFLNGFASLIDKPALLEAEHSDS